MNVHELESLPTSREGPAELKVEENAMRISLLLPLLRKAGSLGLLFAVGLTVACSSAWSGGNNVACRFTLSGVQTGTSNCAAGGVDDGGKFEVDISSQGTTAMQTVVTSHMKLSSAPAVGTYNFDNISDGYISVRFDPL